MFTFRAPDPDTERGGPATRSVSIHEQLAAAPNSTRVKTGPCKIRLYYMTGGGTERKLAIAAAEMICDHLNNGGGYSGPKRMDVFGTRFQGGTYEEILARFRAECLTEAEG